MVGLDGSEGGREWVQKEGMVRRKGGLGIGGKEGRVARVWWGRGGGPASQGRGVRAGFVVEEVVVGWEERVG